MPADATRSRSDRTANRERASGLIDIVGKDCRDCRIPHPGHIGCTADAQALEEDQASTSAALDRQRIAVEVGVSSDTVVFCVRLGLNKLDALEPVEPVRRYERENPGELI